MDCSKRIYTVNQQNRINPSLTPFFAPTVCPLRDRNEKILSPRFETNKRKTRCAANEKKSHQYASLIITILLCMYGGLPANVPKFVLVLIETNLPHF
jgi:hypothetical protein